jgi:hypothetical protein
VAEQRIKRNITSEDQLRLLDRYASQVAGRTTWTSDQREAQ